MFETTGRSDRVGGNVRQIQAGGEEPLVEHDEAHELRRRPGRAHRKNKTKKQSRPGSPPRPTWGAGAAPASPKWIQYTTNPVRGLRKVANSTFGAHGRHQQPSRPGPRLWSNKSGILRLGNLGIPVRSTTSRSEVGQGSVGAHPTLHPTLRSVLDLREVDHLSEEAPHEVGVPPDHVPDRLLLHSDAQIGER